ncbi:MAG: hypothetical protein IT385_11830 [Deltaproteobacteria bacterium]|nr:hypothetical protein [Deltaproteobacteria bacterium]
MIGSVSRRHALVALLLAACADDGGSGATDTKTDVATDTGAATDVAGDTIVNTTCPFAGSWNLQNVLCGDDDITADWFRVIDRTVVTITPTVTGCTVQSANETDECKEEETGTLAPVLGQADTWRVTSAGITKCTPAACTFGGQDAACALGDRASTHDAKVVILDGKLTQTSTVGICSSLGAGTSTTMVFEAR